MQCEKGVNCKEFGSCLYSHNMLEKMFHPDLYKITRCIRGPNSTHCERGEYCAFSHSADDLRHTTSKTKPSGRYALSSTTSETDQCHSQRQPSTHGGINSSRTTNAPDGMSPAKPLTVDSTALLNIQKNLVTLIKSQGVDGIISSELPKRYFDYFGERIELQDEHGEKFRIKDILHDLPDVTMSMHKGVQPKYVYSGSDPCPDSRSRRGKVPHNTDDDALSEVQSKSSSSLSFLAAASGQSSPSVEREKDATSHANPIVNNTNNSDIEVMHSGPDSLLKGTSERNNFPHYLGQPAFSPSGIGQSSHESQGDLNSPFFRDSSTRTEGWSGLLGTSSTHPLKSNLLLGGDNSNNYVSGLISPLHTDEKGDSLSDAFTFPMFGEKESEKNGSKHIQEGKTRNYDTVKVLAQKDSEINKKSMEIEDLKSSLFKLQQLHDEVCRRHKNEKSELQSELQDLKDKCSLLEKLLANANEMRDGEFPVNAFQMNSDPQPFTPQRSWNSPSMQPNDYSKRHERTSPNHNNFGGNGLNQQTFMDHGMTSYCGLHGCTAEGTYMCSGCRRVGYCGPQHQAADWHYHKDECGLH